MLSDINLLEVTQQNSNFTRLSAIKSSTTSYDIAQRQQQTVTPLKLSAGTWLVIGFCNSSGESASGIYNFGIEKQTVRNDNKNGGGCVNSMFITLNAETAISVSLYQDVTTTLKMRVYLQAIRIG